MIKEEQFCHFLRIIFIWGPVLLGGLGKITQFLNMSLVIKDGEKKICMLYNTLHNKNFISGEK